MPNQYRGMDNLFKGIANKQPRKRYNFRWYQTFGTTWADPQDTLISKHVSKEDALASRPTGVGSFYLYEHYYTKAKVEYGQVLLEFVNKEQEGD